MAVNTYQIVVETLAQGKATSEKQVVVEIIARGRAISSKQIVIEAITKARGLTTNQVVVEAITKSRGMKTGQIVIETICGLQRSIKGKITEYGRPVSRTIRAYRRDTGELLSSTVSDAVTGEYLLRIKYTEQCYVVAIDDVFNPNFNAIVVDYVTPIQS